MHLTRPNPIWRALEHDPRRVLSIVDDYAYIPGPWWVEGDTPTSSGVPTSNYASVQLSGEAELVDAPAAKGHPAATPGGALPAGGRDCRDRRARRSVPPDAQGNPRARSFTSSP
ncbi:FMN-binding negative transcriptional regulator [Saccharopolyspora sp. ASAGF58]|uniref:FMN-binding negative transcriptional regulator n=1 Tax=Saccharopolyspora sp. ASAGF58 TaxID=2719023 RepID=UPI002110F635|nr:FMN-binding negative transcriptional regulator [Saccharopolyspora sp. ASAGF58]